MQRWNLQLIKQYINKNNYFSIIFRIILFNQHFKQQQYTINWLNLYLNYTLSQCARQCIHCCKGDVVNICEPCKRAIDAATVLTTRCLQSCDNFDCTIHMFITLLFSAIWPSLPVCRCGTDGDQSLKLMAISCHLMWPHKIKGLG